MNQLKNQFFEHKKYMKKHKFIFRKYVENMHFESFIILI